MTAIPTNEESLEAEIRALRAEIEALEARHRDALDELLAMRSPFQPGDLLEWEVGRYIWTGRVEQILEQDGHPTGWRCRRVRSDGTLTRIVVSIDSAHRPRLIERGAK